MRTLTARWRRALRDWTRRRQGPDIGTVELTGHRIYIVPTRAGLILGVVLLTMLLGALNYSNNMGFALVFLLGAIAVVSIHQCQRNLAGLHVRVGGVEPVFAGEDLRCEIELTNPGRAARWQIAVGPADETTRTLDLGSGARVLAPLTLPTRHRGLLPCPEVRLSTVFPLGLFRAWAVLHPETELLVWPAPAGSDGPVSLEGDGNTAEGGTGAPGAEDFAGLRTLLPGESPARIAWKSLARTGTLLAKDYRGGNSIAVLDWHALPAELDAESRLSVLTGLLLAARRRGQAFGLRLPGLEIPAGADRSHAESCLRALALFPASGGGT